ncbi:hypothetical protein NX794_07500 [Streptomyces sp. LP11]|uniref:Uncharacterized protein n=1 Tax=Streptomyces pyxinicus TaxID=2970331 RepID=A0ABT2AXV5_9ACTN|nr:hypothetical protein [Streptomyces sp. LP11]MCS0601075.1 hypothetical protein [Streptomyces sp. LP11]
MGLTDEMATEKPKRAPRKADPLAKLLTELRDEMGAAAATFTAIPAYRRLPHDGRASAWDREYARTGALDALILSLAFEVGARPAAELRYALLQLAANAMTAINTLDGAK